MSYGPLKVVVGPVLRHWCRVRVTGLEHVPPSGPAILASNHPGTIDPIILPTVVPRPVTFAAKAEYFSPGHPAGVLLRLIGQMPIERGARRGAREALEASLALLRTGGVFGIYPEGHRSPDGRLYRGRTGVGWLALASGAPVIPVGMVGTQHVLPRGAKVPHRGHVEIRFGRPVDLAAWAGRPEDPRARRAATDAVMDAIAALTDQPRAAGYSPDPPARA